MIEFGSISFFLFFIIFIFILKRQISAYIHTQFLPETADILSDLPRCIAALAFNE